jgi:hypothetical protein
VEVDPDSPAEDEDEESSEESKVTEESMVWRRKYNGFAI